MIAEGDGALAIAAGRRIVGKRKCAVVSGGNVDAGVLAQLLCDVRPQPPRKPRRRVREARERLPMPAATASPPAAGRTPSAPHPWQDHEDEIAEELHA